MRRKCYKSYKTVLSSITILAATAWAQSAQAVTEEDLEPCLNGAVSATGLYASQAEEDRAKRLGIMTNSWIAGQLDLEPCINGGVSATGLHVSEKVEDRVTKGQVDADERVAEVDDDC